MFFFLPGEVDMMWEVVVQVGEGDFVLCPDWLSDDDLVDVIELIPVLIPVSGTRRNKTLDLFVHKPKIHKVFYYMKNNLLKSIGSPIYLLEVNVPDQRLKLGPSGDGHVESLGSEEGLEVKQIEVVVIHQVCEQLVSQAVEGGHHRERELPATVGGAVHKPEDKVKHCYD